MNQLEREDARDGDIVKELSTEVSGMLLDLRVFSVIYCSAKVFL